jgi:hypothetical protein
MVPGDRPLETVVITDAKVVEPDPVQTAPKPKGKGVDGKQGAAKPARATAESPAAKNPPTKK